MLLEQFIGRDILYVPCRRHIFEVVFSGVFYAKMPPSTGPTVIIFKRLQDSQSEFDLLNFKSVLHVEISKLFKKEKTYYHCLFRKKTLRKEEQPWDDYKEFLILVPIFLRQKDKDQVHFPPPGSIHHAHWMAKCSYCLKMYLLRDQFTILQVLVPLAAESIFCFL